MYTPMHIMSACWRGIEYVIGNRSAIASAPKTIPMKNPPNRYRRETGCITTEMPWNIVNISPILNLLPK